MPKFNDGGHGGRQNGGVEMQIEYDTRRRDWTMMMVIMSRLNESVK